MTLKRLGSEVTKWDKKFLKRLFVITVIVITKFDCISQKYGKQLYLFATFVANAKNMLDIAEW